MEFTVATAEQSSHENLIGRFESNGSVPTDIFGIPEKFTYQTGQSDHLETEIGEHGEVYVMGDTVEEPEL